jgi:hypothetical protein
MALWGKTSNAESRPKSLPMDSNSTYSREFVTANKKGWVFQPGLASAATGNDNTSAAPEILVCIRNLSVSTQSANLLSIDYTAGAYADAADFDLVLTFDEAITVTSAAATANQTITNKAYILLSRLGQTDMVEDSTMACQYFSGSGSNQITFRGVAQTNAAAGYLAFNGQGVGDAGVVTGINFNGTATMTEEDGASALGIRLEPGTTGAAANTKGDSLIAPLTVADLPALAFAISESPLVFAAAPVVPGSKRIPSAEAPSSSVIVAVPLKLIPVTTPASPTP